MNIENLSYVCTAGVALAAIIVPLFTNWIVCHSQYRMKKLEFVQTTRLSAYNEWCESAAKIIDPFNTDIAEHYSHLIGNEYKALVVADKKTKKAILKYSQALRTVIESPDKTPDYKIQLNILFEDVMSCMNNNIRKKNYR